jgi:hypothetical protein
MTIVISGKCKLKRKEKSNCKPLYIHNAVFLLDSKLMFMA